MELEDFMNEILMGKFRVIKKKVGNHTNSGAVYLPKDLIGKEVIIIIKNE